MIRGTREWAVAEINCCLGCPYNCRYCYARTAALRRGLIDTTEQWCESRILSEEVERLQPRYQGQVMFPTAHDIFEDNLEAALTVIENLLAAGNRVLIVSKPSVFCIARICDTFHSRREQIVFRFTIGCRNASVLSFWEPGAPCYQERLQALELCFQRGYTTSVSIEPMLDIDDLAGLVDEIEPFISHSIWIGKMNRIAERVRIDSEEMRREISRIEREQSDERILRMYRRLKDKDLIRWKESIKEVVGLPLATEMGLDR